jgi:hypothetical protein
MTDRRPPTSDQFLVAWFEDGPTRMPDRVFDVVADRIGRQRQRRSWRLLWRLQMHTQLKLVAALAAIVVVAVAGYTLLPKAAVGPGAGPKATPQPTVAPTAVASPTTAAATCDTAFSCADGVLAGGAHHTNPSIDFQTGAGGFDPGFAFVVPGGSVGGPPAASWRNVRQWIDMYELHAPSSAAASDFTFIVHSLVAIPVQNDSCTAEMQAGAGKAPADWIDFLTGNPGLVTSTPVATTLPGASGFTISFTRAPDATRLCPGSAGPAVVVMTDDNAAGGKVWWVDDQRETWTILDVAGKTVIIGIESDPNGPPEDVVLSVADPIIQSFDFTR